MKASIKLYDTDGAGQYGFPVKLILYHDKKRRRKIIGYSFEADWDPIHQLPTPDHDDFEALYGKIMDIKKKAAKMEFRELEDFDDAWAYLLDRKAAVKDFYFYAQERIDYMRKLKREGNALAYEQSVIELKKLFPELPMKDFTKSNLIEFKEWKKSQGNANATVKKYLSELRAIYNAGVEKSYYKDSEPFKGVFKGLKVRVRAKTGYLLKCCLKVLNTLEVTPAQRRSIDIGMLQFYLGGSSFIDVYKLKWEYINNSRVYFPYREKMKDERGAPYDVRIYEVAWEIINKYRGEDPVYVFPWRKDDLGIRNFRGNMNDDLKEVQKKFGVRVHPTNINLTTSVFRKSFGTIGKFMGYPEDILRELMGHEREDIDNAYKDRFLEHERDAAQLEIIRI